jgi:hypothetical protein
MNHELKEIEWTGNPGDPAYLRYTKLPVARTEAYANGEVNVDLDGCEDVVGIEMLSFEPEEWLAVAEIGKAHGLRFDLFLGNRRSA